MNMFTLLITCIYVKFNLEIVHPGAQTHYVRKKGLDPSKYTIFAPGSNQEYM